MEKLPRCGEGESILSQVQYLSSVWPSLPHPLWHFFNFKFNPWKCYVESKVEARCAGNLLVGTVKRKMELVKDCCYILEELDEICIPRWLSGISPVNLANKRSAQVYDPKAASQVHIPTG